MTKIERTIFHRIKDDWKYRTDLATIKPVVVIDDVKFLIDLIERFVK